MNDHDELDDVWRERLLRYEYDATREAYARHSDRYWLMNMWVWRIASAVAVAALIWVAFHSDRKSDAPPHYPTWTTSER